MTDDPAATDHAQGRMRRMIQVLLELQSEKLEGYPDEITKGHFPSEDCNMEGFRTPSGTMLSVGESMGHTP